jgi:hypothetical protein
MEFLIVFGGIILLIALVARQFIQWEIDPNACNMEQEEKMVKTNRRAFYGMVIGGSLLILIGLISVLI